ncbi:transcription termination/antitermination protein NusG [Pollutimonas bauzanensis]|uniref:transcription termination/antitermination protein NusG n=1 Tax=Pollutimonas bauzanensis TaxID=658167 RepID=UPI001FECD855|nr:transcription termination/antitermination NusG family protein [Pollutimonas bauzanensis]
MTDAGWYVAYTKPRQEYVAQVNLNQQAFQTYLPLFKILKKPSAQLAAADSGAQGPGAGADEGEAALTAYEPMFPRYLFFRPSSRKQSIAAARSSRGVNSLVTFGTELAVVSPDVLQTIRKLEDQRNRAGLQAISPFQPGRRVRLRNTALNGIEGVVQAVRARRVILLMEFLGQQKTVKVKHGQVELV